jgi:sterol desaturase/sphingolipid hydroxylase (fatty acid hydroxylase superfamily)
MEQTLYDLWKYPEQVKIDFYARFEEFTLQWDILLVAGSVFWTLMILQIILCVARRQREKVWEPAANIAMYIFTAGIELTYYGLIVVGAFLLLEDVQLFTIPITAATWVACLLLTDFNYYWYHRIQHRVRILWGVHSVHHSSEEYDLSTGVRLFVFGDLILWVYFAPMVLIGFDPAQVLTCMLAIFGYAAWMHLDSFPKLGPLEGILSTPSNHRVHHGVNRQYIDKNYGGILIIWDRILGTYEPEKEKVRYGLTQQVRTSDPLRISFHEFINIYKDVTAADNWSDKINYLIKGPGWRPSKEPAESAPSQLSGNRQEN